jgi:ATP-dependent Clp protease protease subunit
VSGPDWLREKLFERRIVMLTGPLDHALAAQVQAQLLALDAPDAEPIVLHVDSADGALAAAFVVMDAMDALSAPVHALCRGRIGGASLGVVASAARRTATPHARFRLSQPRSRFSGTPDEIAARSREQQDLMWRLHARLARATGRPAEEVAEDLRRGRFLDANEALAYGLVEEVLTSSAS